MDRWIGKTAVVTGAASGIGEAITRALLRKGINVVALDIQKEELDNFVKRENAAKRREGFTGILHGIHCNVTVEKDIDAAFQQIDAYGGVDIMINNAGTISYQRVIDSDRQEFEKLLNVIVLAVAVCTNKAVRSMRNRNVEGHIFNINSTLGHEMPIYPQGKILNSYNIYPACKHASVCLTKTISQEIKAVKAPIRVTSINPGLVNTNITKQHTEEIIEFFNRLTALQPDDIADVLIYALGTPPTVEITELSVRHIDECIN